MTPPRQREEIEIPPPNLYEIIGKKDAMVTALIAEVNRLQMEIIQATKKIEELQRQLDIS